MMNMMMNMMNMMKGHLYKAQPTAGLGTRYISLSKDIVNHSNVQHEAK